MIRTLSRTLILIAVATVGVGAAFCEYPDSPQAAASSYMERRARLKVAGPVDADALRTNGPAIRGKTVEVPGRIVGRSVEKAEDGDLRVCLMLQAEDGTTLFVDTQDDMQVMRVGQAVRALVAVPARDGVYGRCKLDAIVLECDLPATSKPASAITTNSLPKAAPVEPPTVQLTPIPGMPRSEAPVLKAQDYMPAALPPGEADAPKPVIQPATTADVRRKIEMWKTWVGKQNPALSDEQRECIVRWVIYYSAESGVDHRLSFSMISAESDFHPDCLSHAGAMGLTQLMPCNLEDYHVGNPWNVQDNIRGGIAHMADMISNFRGHSNYDQFALGLAAYNAGLGRVRRAGGIPNIRETINYVKRVGDLFCKLVREGYP